ncbi:hypothetical protein ACFXGD_06710 [Streptomyces albidoflavus]
MLAGLVADPECRAVQVMERAGVDRELLRRRLDAEPVPPAEGRASHVGEQAGPIDVSALRRELGAPQERPGPER